MDVHSLVPLFSGTFSPDVNIRKEAEERLVQIAVQPGVLTFFCKHLLQENVEMHVRQAAAIFVKNTVLRRYGELSTTDVDYLIENSISLISATPTLIQSQLSCVLQKLVDKEYPSRFPNFSVQISSGLSSGNMQSTLGALIAVRAVAKRFSYVVGEERMSLEEMANSVFPVILRLFQSILEQDINQLAVLDQFPLLSQIILVICKIFYGTVQLRLPGIVSAPATWDIWGPLFARLLYTPFPSTHPSSVDFTHSLWLSKKWAATTIYRIFVRFGNPVFSDEEYKEFANRFLGSSAQTFTQIFLHLLSAPQREEPLSPKVALRALNYLAHATQHSVTYKVMKPHLEHILLSHILPFLCFSSEDKVLWQDDPVEYINKSYDPMEEFSDPSKAAVDLLATLCTCRRNDFLPLTINFMSSFFQKYSGSEKDAVGMSGVMMILGTLDETLQSDKLPYRSQLEIILRDNIFPEFGSPYGFLRAKACWICSRYAEAPFQDQRNIENMVNSIIRLLRDPELPVRIEAGIALKDVLKIESSVNLVRPILGAVLEQYVVLMHSLENDFLVMALEDLIKKFDLEILPYAAQMMEQLIVATTRYLDDLSYENDKSSFAAASSLGAIDSLVMAIHTSTDVLAGIEAQLLPLLTRLLADETFFEFLDETCSIIAHLTFYSTDISLGMWELFPRVCHTFENHGVDMFECLLPVLDNFISIGRDYFVTRHDFMDMVLRICQTGITANASNDRSLWDSPKLMCVILEHCKGHVDQYVDPFLQLCVNTLHRAQTKTLRVLLLNVIADALYYNPRLTTNILEKHSFTEFVLNVWFEYMPDYRRNYDMKVACLGLCGLLSLGSQMPPLILHGNGVQSLLEKLLELLMKLENSENDDDGNDDGEGDAESVNNSFAEYLDGEITEDQDVFDRQDKAYIDALKQKIIDLRDGHLVNDDDELSLDEDEESYVSVIHSIDEIVTFSDTIHALHDGDFKFYEHLLAPLPSETQQLLSKVVAEGERRKAEGKNVIHF